LEGATALLFTICILSVFKVYSLKQKTKAESATSEQSQYAAIPTLLRPQEKPLALKYLQLEDVMMRSLVNVHLTVM